MVKEFTLDDLVNQSGFTLRTIRFYIQEGLLDGPDVRGRFSTYSQRHLDRLEVIRHLKGLHLNLQDIRTLLDSMTTEEISKIRSQQDLPTPILLNSSHKTDKMISRTGAGQKALEYIRNLEIAQKKIQQFGNVADTESLTKESQSIQKNLEWSTPKNQEYGVHENWRRVRIKKGIEILLHENIFLSDEQKIKQMVAYLNQLFDGEQ